MSCHRARCSGFAPIVTTIVVANLVNVVLNWILIFGKFGAPAMGAVGAGVASSISRCVLAIMILPIITSVTREVFETDQMRDIVNTAIASNTTFTFGLLEPSRMYKAIAIRLKACGLLVVS